MIQIHEIKDDRLDHLIKKFDDCIDNLKTQFNSELKTYGNFLRFILNNIQPETYFNLIERVKVNKELERILDFAGGYTIDILGEKNPKLCLLEIIQFLQTTPLKLNNLIDFINKDVNRKIIIADTNDIDYLSNFFNNNPIKFISIRELKRILNGVDNIVFYSFNGKKDFDFIYNLETEISLVIYSQEKQLYYNQLQKRKKEIENEVMGFDRKFICDISYEPIPDLPINLSQTIENIVNRIDSLGNNSYENYKEETDILLDEIEEKIIYNISFSNNSKELLESNDTVYNEIGDLIKVYRIKVFDNIRIYPKEQFAEKLYQVAVETDKEVFGKVEEHSKEWKSVLEELRIFYKNSLYNRLKKKGIRVMQSTVESYFNSNRKFPMFNSDLKAIYKLKYLDLDETEIDSLLAPIRKSKSTYNNTMIALGRGIKQEMKLYLKEKKMGEILTKLRFTTTTLQTFIDEFMPLLAITNKVVYLNTNGQLEFNFIQPIEE